MVGLAAVAALPVQESAASTQQDDLLQAILTVNPEENNIFPDEDNKLPVSQTKDGKQALTEEITEEQLQQHSQLEDPLKEVQQKNLPEEQKETSPGDPVKEQDEVQQQDSSHEQKQTQSQDPPEEEEEVKSQSLPQEVTQPQIQVHEQYFPDVTEAESPAEELSQSEPQLILVDTEETLPHVLEKIEDDETTSFSKMEGLPIEPNDDYMMINVKEEAPFLDMGSAFTHGHLEEKTSFDQEPGPVLYFPEKLPSKPQMDYIQFESEPQKESYSEELHPQMDPISYDYGAPLGREEESFSSEPQTESDYEQMPWDIKEKSGDEYDYEFPAETYQENREGLDSVPSEDSYYSDQEGVPADTLSWHVPDFFDEEPSNYDDSLYDSSYYDQVPTIEDHPQNKPKTMFEQQVPYAGKWEEPSISEVSGPSDFLDGSLLRDEGDVAVIEEIPLDMTDSDKRITEDISLADYFIPEHTYDGSQEYSSDVTPEDEVQESDFPGEEAFFVDSSSTEDEPLLMTDVDELEALSENGPSEDSRYISQWSVESDRGDRRVIPEGDETITILETQPLHIPDMQTDISYPIILEEVLEKNAEEGQNAPWSNSESLMMEFTPEADLLVDSSLPKDRDYLSEASDDDGMEIIMINGPKENFDNFPATPIMYGSDNTRGRQPQTAWYPENDHQQLYWVPHRNSDRPDPKMYYSFTDEVQRRNFPRSFEPMNDRVFSSYFSSRPLETVITGDQFSIINDIHDEIPRPYFTAPSTSSRYEFKSLDFPFSNRNYPKMFTTPRLSFQDLLQNFNPSYYNSMHAEDNHGQIPSKFSSHSYNPFLRYNGLSKQYSYTKPFLPYYSLPIKSINDNDYLLEENYHPNKLDLSSYETNNMPPSIYFEDTMPGMYSRGSKRHYEDYTNDHPFLSTYFYSLPSSPPLTFERQQYDDNFPSFNKPQYSQESYYSTGPYHPKPIYTRYAPMYHGM